MDWLSDVWHDVTNPQPAPSTTATLITAAVVLACLVIPSVWHIARHALTIVHEAAHAFVAVLVGRRLSGIRVHSDTSGLTVSVGKPRGPGMVATAAAGYPGPAIVGLGAAWFLSLGYTVGVLWALLVLVVLVLVQIRNWYGLWAVLVSGAVLVAVTVWGSSDVQGITTHAVTWFLLLGAPRAVLEMQSQRRGLRRSGRQDTSDAGSLGRLTHLPGGFWVAVLLLVCLGALALGGWWLLSAR
ncbi:M50 family metallopeptidase [Cellulomonas rhizosphaerae]|uniref:M50 family peptidase n=1 Tax=Cellulomonas rhizosphaerae TaxID=2293719 RepID=A0A413RH06_9CELL|nr:M50 family metallopeptidase [Cellulomonas rhizosphaerae]RHA37085.1 M50 family peptidase [Cellulomonas rhizosphaerae]